MTRSCGSSTRSTGPRPPGRVAGHQRRDRRPHRAAGGLLRRHRRGAVHLRHPGRRRLGRLRRLDGPALLDQDDERDLPPGLTSAHQEWRSRLRDLAGPRAPTSRPGRSGPAATPQPARRGGQPVGAADDRGAGDRDVRGDRPVRPGLDARREPVREGASRRWTLRRSTRRTPRAPRATGPARPLKAMSFVLAAGPTSLKVSCEQVQQELSTEVLPLVSAFVEVTYDFRAGTLTVVAGSKGGQGGRRRRGRLQVRALPHDGHEERRPEGRGLAGRAQRDGRARSGRVRGSTTTRWTCRSSPPARQLIHRADPSAADLPVAVGAGPRGGRRRVRARLRRCPP